MSRPMRVAIFMKTGCSKCLRLATFGEHHLGVQRLHFGKAKKGLKLHNHVGSGKFKIRSDTVQTSQWRHSARFAAIDRESVARLEDATAKVDSQKDVSLPEFQDVQKLSSSVVSDQSKGEKGEPSMKHFSLHFRKSAVILNIDARHDAKEVSFHIPNTSSVIHVKLDSVPVDETNPSKVIESVEEVLWQEVILDKSKLLQHYLMLSKIRLTGLVVVTTMAGYAMAPAPFHIGTFLFCTLGTTLTSCSANAFNQYFEVPFDSQMNRTKNRVLVRGKLSSLHAVSFAVISGSLGLTVLTAGVNPLTAALGAFNVGLYTMVYTPMKRYSIANTWVGSVVGAIPPVMGWTACTGSIDSGAMLLAAIMYAWQFPHFNALSWNLRPDYSRSGYRMTSVVNPALCKRVALRYSVGMIGLCTLAPVMDVTTWVFALDSFPLNAYMTYLAWQFYRKGDSNTSRKLFRFTLVHIPALLILMLVSKKSLGDVEPVAQSELAVTKDL